MSSVWSFHNPVKIHFGAGCVGPALAQLPQRHLLLVTTPGMTRRGTVDLLKESCPGKIAAIFDGVKPNPEMAELDALARVHRQAGHDGIVALGGGSAIDTGKILAVLLGVESGFSLKAHFLEKRTIPAGSALPVIAIPTTAGTGSEVTPFATVWDVKVGKKYSLADARMFPAQALLQPELTHGLPWEVTLATGLDAICQAFESIWNRNANPVTMGLAMQGAKLAWLALQRGQALMQSPQARAELMNASLLAGLAISHTRTALCHSISYPITARTGLPHGLACALSMPAVLEFNTARDDGRLSRLAKVLGCATPAELCTKLSELLGELGVSGLVTAKAADPRGLCQYADEMITPGRANNNLREATVTDIRNLLQRTHEMLFAGA